MTTHECSKGLKGDQTSVGVLAPHPSSGITLGSGRHTRARARARRRVDVVVVVSMDAADAERCLALIREHRPDMKQFAEVEVEVKYDAAPLGEGGFCTAYRAVFRGEEVCARVVDSSKESQVVAEVATVGDLPKIAIKVYGCATTTRASDGKKYLAVLSELCENGCLEDFMVREKAQGRELSERVKLDVFLQVAEGLEELKRARVVWRDLKAKNLLVRSVIRNAFGTVTKITIGFTDWGTAVRLPKVGKRRMTLQGPGTCGYIAPETRGPHYDFQADMWAFLVWAASMCLSVDILVDCQLEEALGELKLEKKIAATAGQEARVKEILTKFDVNVVRGCEVLFEFLKSTTWVDANERWSSDEAIEEMVDFRAANDLHLPMGGCTPARPTSYPEESVQATDCNDPDADGNEDEGEEVEQQSPCSAYALTPGPNFATTPMYAPTPYAMTPAIESCTPGPRWHPLMNRQLVELPPPLFLQREEEPAAVENVTPMASTPLAASVTPSAAARMPLRPVTNECAVNGSENQQPQKKRRGRPPKLQDCPPPTKKVKNAPTKPDAAPTVDNSMALVLVSKGCSKCRWSAGGCGKCDPDTARLPRGPGAKKNTIKAPVVQKRGPGRPRKHPKPSVPAVDNSKALVLASKGCSKCRWSANGCGKCDPDTARLPRGPKAKKAPGRPAKRGPGRPPKNAVDNSMALVLVTSKGCSKCRYAANGCGACDPLTERSARGPRASKALAVKKTTQTKKNTARTAMTKSSQGLNKKFPSKSRKYVDVNTGKVSEVIVVPCRNANGKPSRGRPRLIKPPRTELGCTKCRYASKGCGKCRDELKQAQLLSIAAK